MFLPLGSLLNTVAVIAGAAIGLYGRNFISAPVRNILTQVLGLSTLGIGIQMCASHLDTLSPGQSVMLLLCLGAGAVWGEACHLDRHIERAAEYLKRKMNCRDATFTEGFVNAAILFCVGAMALVGAVNEGLSGDRNLLYSKSVLDFFSAVIFAALWGRGVMAAALPVFLLEASVTLLAGALAPYFTPIGISFLSATGAIMILGVGLTILDIRKISLSNMLPALLCAFFIVLFIL